MRPLTRKLLKLNFVMGGLGVVLFFIPGCLIAGVILVVLSMCILTSWAFVFKAAGEASQNAYFTKKNREE